MCLRGAASGGRVVGAAAVQQRPMSGGCGRRRAAREAARVHPGVRAAGRPAAWGPLCPVRRPRLKRTRVWRSESWERGGATHTENCSRIKRCDQSWFLKTFCRGKDVKESEGET